MKRASARVRGRVSGVCDSCPGVANGDKTDVDADGVGNACDECPDTAGPDPDDADDDGAGEACEEQQSAEPAGNEDDNNNNDNTTAGDNANDNGTGDPEVGQPVTGGIRRMPCAASITASP